MTTTVKVHVNGNYEATVTKNGGEEVAKVGPQEEKAFQIYHSVTGENKSTFVIEERYLGDQPKS